MARYSKEVTAQPRVSSGLYVYYTQQWLECLDRHNSTVWRNRERHGCHCKYIYFLAVARPDSSPQVQVIAVYTFATVMWGTFGHELLAACLVMIFIFIFLIVFIGVTVGTQTHGTHQYMTPAGVSGFLQRCPSHRVYAAAIVLVLDRQRVPL